MPLEAFLRSRTPESAALTWDTLDVTLNANERFVQARPSDGARILYEIPAAIDGAAKGATWDATEAARYAEIGGAGANLANANVDAAEGDAPAVVFGQVSRDLLLRHYRNTSRFQGPLTAGQSPTLEQTYLVTNGAAITSPAGAVAGDHYGLLIRAGETADVDGATYPAVPRAEDSMMVMWNDGAAWRMLGQAAGSEVWLVANNGQTLDWGNRYIFGPNQTLTFPPVTENAGSNWLIAVPANHDWGAINSVWNGSGTDTIGANQAATITAVSDAIRFIGFLGGVNANISLFVGGDATAPVFETVNTRTALPPPNTVQTGTTMLVVNDPTPALNGLALAFGTPGTTASGWTS